MKGLNSEPVLSLEAMRIEAASRRATATASSFLAVRLRTSNKSIHAHPMTKYCDQRKLSISPIDLHPYLGLCA